MVLARPAGRAGSLPLALCCLCCCVSSCSGRQHGEGLPRADSQADALVRARVLESLAGVKAACAVFGGVAVHQHLAVVGPGELAGIQGVSRACHWVDGLWARTAEAAPGRRGRRLQDCDTTTGCEDPAPSSWLARTLQFKHPWTSLLFLAILLAAVICCWEVFWLRSTVCRRLPSQNTLANEASPSKAVVGDDDDEDDERTSIVHDLHADSESKRFWESLDDGAPQPALRKVGSCTGDIAACVRFTHRSFYVYDCDTGFSVSVERTGPCLDRVVVRARTAEKESANFAAKAGVDFHAMETDVIFEEGERVKTFEVIAYDKPHFNPGRWFRVELTSIVAGEAVLYPQRHARIFIVGRHRFPAGMRSEDDSKYALIWNFIRECMSLRRPQNKFWKTMLGISYRPIHTVVVVSLVQKFMVDWATAPEGFSHYHILLLAGVQFTSSLLLRWADNMVTKSRGRTGGIRQTHRLWLLQKLLLLDHEAKWQVQDSKWFYVAVRDVDAITVDIYWQAFMIVQHSFALFLTFAVLIFVDVYRYVGEGLTYDTKPLPALVVSVLLVPMSCVWLVWRHEHLAGHIQGRSTHEAGWMDTWSWVAHSAHFDFGLGLREAAAIENQFRTENANFLKHNQAARDLMHDGSWITLWLSTVSYLCILVWGGFALAAGRRGTPGPRLEAGQYMLLLKLYYKLGGILLKLSTSLIQVQRGYVSLRRVRELLSLGKAAAPMALEDRPKESSVKLRAVQVRTADGVGPFGEVRMAPSAELVLPLGRVVRVTGSDEGALMSVLGLTAGVFRPSAGVVECPTYVQRIMLPPIPAYASGRLTVVEELQLAGAPAHLAERLAKVLGLDPGRCSESMPPGGLQLLSLARGLLRDPEVLVLARPLAFVPAAQRPRIVRLLRLWQSSGGLQAVLRRLSDGGGASKPASALISQRTLVLTDEDICDRLDSDVFVDLDRFVSGPAMRTPKAQRAMQEAPNAQPATQEAIPDHHTHAAQPGGLHGTVTEVAHQAANTIKVPFCSRKVDKE